MNYLQKTYNKGTEYFNKIAKECAKEGAKSFNKASSDYINGLIDSNIK
jgi:hypothetical protein